MSKINTEILDKFTKQLDERCSLEEAWTLSFPQPDPPYLADCKPYLLHLLNDENAGNRYNAAEFLGSHYFTKDVGQALHRRLKIETNKTVAATLRGDLKHLFYKRFPELIME